MNTLIGFLTILSIVIIVAGAPSSRPPAGPSWFDLQPHMRESKSRTGRAQQTHRHGKRRY